jgi:hypothetical protein
LDKAVRAAREATVVTEVVAAIIPMKARVPGAEVEGPRATAAMAAAAAAAGLSG